MAKAGISVVGGPFDVVVSTTTIGHTKEGATILTTQEYQRIHTHESGIAAVAIHPRGGRMVVLEVGALEITDTALELLFHDVSVAANSAHFRSSKRTDALPSYNTLQLLTANASGADVAFRMSNVVAMVDEFEILGKLDDDAVAVINAKFEGLWTDSATIMAISLTGISS